MAKNKKLSPSEIVEKSSLVSQDGYVFMGGTASQKAAAMKQYGETIQEFDAIHRTEGAISDDFSNLLPGISAKPGYDRRHYDAFRSDEAIPTKFNEIVCSCDTAYEKIGIIRNIFDLMSDFACQGIRLVHPNKQVEKFYQNWWSRVNGTDRSERFLNSFYVRANVPVRKYTAKINLKEQEEIQRSAADADIKVKSLKPPKKEIPMKYEFLHPSVVEPIGGILSTLLSKPRYGIKISSELRREIKKAIKDLDPDVLAELPQDIVKAAQSNQKIIPIPPEKFSIWHYKKNDWEIWAKPMIYSVLDDIGIYVKLRLADVTALDGAISKVRIFKLGDIANKIMPTKGAAAKLYQILQSNTTGGTIDIVWGPDINIIETATDTWQFLGEEKYKPHLTAIYNAFGIPPTLTGTGGGTTNNFISLKTLVERLKYGRAALIQFWTAEVIEVQKAMGFRFPASIEFDHMNLGSEDSWRALLVQMSDRNLVSDELLQYHMGHNPDMERVRLNREKRERDNETRVPKSGPFYDPQFDLALEKIALQTGVVTPSQLGLDLEEPKKTEILPIALKKKEVNTKKAATQLPVKKGQPQQGRPKTSKDKVKRKKKTFKPKAKASLLFWADAAQNSLNNVLNEGLLIKYGKKNMRQLTAKEQEEADYIKFSTFYHLEPMQEVSNDAILAALNKGNLPSEVYTKYQKLAAKLSKSLKRPLTTDELRKTQVITYIGVKNNV